MKLATYCKSLQCYVCKKSVDEVIFQQDPCQSVCQYIIKCHGESASYEVTTEFLKQYLLSEITLSPVFKPETNQKSLKPSSKP